METTWVLLRRVEVALVKRHWEYERIYIVVREDPWGAGMAGVTLVSAFASHDSAEVESARLQLLEDAREGPSRYLVASTKYYPHGRTVGPLGEGQRVEPSGSDTSIDEATEQGTSS